MYKALRDSRRTWFLVCDEKTLIVTSKNKPPREECKKLIDIWEKTNADT